MPEPMKPNRHEATDVSREFVSGNPGRDVQRVGTARFLGQDVAKVHDPVWGVIGTLGDSQCYLGVQSKVAAVHAALAKRIRDDDLGVRLIAPAFTLGVSDGQLNGTDRMRYSLTSRELVNDSTEAHLKANDMAGVIAVVACDKPPVGTLAAVLEHNAPALLLSDGSIQPGLDPVTGERIDLVTAFQHAADPDADVRARLALHACPGQGSCGGMFTYNTMQTFIGVLGMEPLHMVAPVSDDQRRTTSFPDELAGLLSTISAAGIRPRDIVTPAAMRNAFVVVMAMGGSTNVVLHGPEIARAAGFDLWDDVLSQQEFNELSRRLPVLVNLRPFGEYSMVDVDAIGGVAVIVKELLDAGALDGSALTCTGETLAEQVERLDPPAPDGSVVHAMRTPFKPTGGLRLLQGNLAPDGGAVLKVAGVESGIVDIGDLDSLEMRFQQVPFLLVVPPLPLGDFAHLVGVFEEDLGHLCERLAVEILPFAKAVAQIQIPVRGELPIVPRTRLNRTCHFVIQPWRNPYPR